MNGVGERQIEMPSKQLCLLPVCVLDWKHPYDDDMGHSMVGAPNMELAGYNEDPAFYSERKRTPRHSEVCASHPRHQEPG